MEKDDTLPLSSDERLWAALAHGSVIFMGWGLLASVAVWITQRGKSPYATFQALQALVYQMFQRIFIILVSLVTQVLAIPLLIGGLNWAERTSLMRGIEPEMLAMFPIMLIMLVMVCLIGLYFLIGIVGAISCVTGREFRYPIIGRWMEKYLTAETSIEEVD